MRDITTAVFKELSNQIGQVKQKTQENSIKHGPTAYPSRAIMLHEDSIATVGSLMTDPYTNVAQPYNAIVKQNVPANGNTFTNSCILQSGDYLLSILGVTGPDAGILDWYVDDTLFEAGQDWYTASYVFAARKFGIFTVTYDGYHIFKAVVNGKNAASSNYFIYLTHFLARQGAD